MANNENLSEKALAEILNKALDGIDFATDQAPMVVQELITYMTFSHVARFIVFLILTIAASRLIFWSIKKKKEAGEYRGEEFTFCAAGAIILALIFGFCALSDAFSFVKIMIAPKVYLIEHAARLVQ